MSIFDEREKDENKCSVCGLALYNHEIGAACVDGDFVEFTSRSWGTLSLVFCEPCWTKINGNINEPYEKALKRRKEKAATFTPEKKKNGG